MTGKQAGHNAIAMALVCFWGSGDCVPGGIEVKVPGLGSTALMASKFVQ